MVPRGLRGLSFHVNFARFQWGSKPLHECSTSFRGIQGLFQSVIESFKGASGGYMGVS